jgi:hypothetical protein
LYDRQQQGPLLRFCGAWQDARGGDAAASCAGLWPAGAQGHPRPEAGGGGPLKPSTATVDNLVGNWLWAPQKPWFFRLCLGLPKFEAVFFYEESSTCTKKTAL